MRVKWAAHGLRAYIAGGEIMRNLIVILTLAALAGCGVETATTAATATAIKKLGVDDGKKSMEQAQKNVDKAVAEMHGRAEKDAEKN
jgi:hypothetical protein